MDEVSLSIIQTPEKKQPQKEGGVSTGASCMGPGLHVWVQVSSKWWMHDSLAWNFENIKKEPQCI